MAEITREQEIAEEIERFYSAYEYAGTRERHRYARLAAKLATRFLRPLVEEVERLRTENTSLKLAPGPHQHAFVYSSTGALTTAVSPESVCACGMTYRQAVVEEREVIALRERVAALEALREYGSHTVGCGSIIHRWGSKEPPCDCGFGDVLAALASAPAPDRVEPQP